MANACEKCSADVEPGAVFCGQCSAPQIRVAPQVPVFTPASTPVEHTTSPRIRWNQAFPAILMFAVMAVLLCVAPLSAYLFLIWMPLAGALAVSRYGKRVQSEVPLRSGVVLGMLTGFFGGMLYSFILIFAAFFTPAGKILHDEMERAIANAAAGPQAEQLRQLLLSENGFRVLIFATIAVIVMMFMILSALGGAVAAYRSRTSA